MTELTNENDDAKETRPVTDVENDPILASILSGYKEAPMSIDEPVQKKGDDETPTNENEPPLEYYKTGKKAGQPKPRKKNAVTKAANFNDDMTIQASDILTGALFITLIDILIPLLIEVINNRFSKDKIKASDLTLTAEQQKRLTPIADQLCKRLQLNLHPGLLLILGLAGVYGLNFAAVKAIGKKE